MSDQTWERVHAIVREHFRAQYPKRIAELLGMAKFDLYFGPNSQQDYAEEDPTRETLWPGYVEATEEIEAYFSKEIPRQCWVDMNWEGVLTREPEGEWVECDNDPDECHEEHDADGRVWQEPFWEDIYVIENVHSVLLGELYRNGCCP